MTDNTPNDLPPVDSVFSAIVAPAEVPTKTFEIVIPPKVDPFVEKIIETANDVFDDPTVQVTISKVTPKIGSRAREVIYEVGFYAGLVGSVAPIVAAALTGNGAIAVATIGAVALAFNSWLAKANLSRTAEDVDKAAA